MEKEGKTDFVEKTVVEKTELVALPKETSEFFKGDEIRSRVFYEKYALKDSDGTMLERTPDQMWARVAKVISEVEASPEKRKEWDEKFKWLLGDFRFLPGGRILFAAGQPRKSTLLNCYVIPVKNDTIEDIFDWCKEAARTYSYGGGVGTDISILRPRNSPVNNSAVYSTGSVSFMNLFSETTHTIGQHGRRGALMITIRVDHPDVLSFIRIKRNLATVRYANISVKITDEFMEAVKNDRDFALRFENGVVGKVNSVVRARELWDELVRSARDWAEPGLIFWDTMKKYSPSEYNGMEIIGTNPCSEQPLQAYGACDLGNINLSAFVEDAFTDKAHMEWDMIDKAVKYSVRFLDDVLDYNYERHPLKAQAEAAKSSRRIGLGITGLGDMLVKLKIRYDSERALAFVDELFERIKSCAYMESVEIAKEKGSFPLFDAKKHLSMPFIQTLNNEIKDGIEKHGLRNVAVLTVPPTGSVSVLAGTSSGIEPIFAFSYTRRSESLSQEYYKVYHPLAMEYMRLFNIADEDNLPDFFVPAHKIDAEFRVRMQATIQKHIDSAISSTVNLPNDVSVEEVGKIYMQAWESGCKGITVYREGSREGILITEEQQKKKEQKENEPVEKKAEELAWRRDMVLSGQTMKVTLPNGSPMYLTANFDSTSIREVFINLGKTGSEEKSYAEAIGRLISKYLQQGGDVREVIESMKGIKSNSSIGWDHGMKIYSVPDAIAKSLEIVAGITAPPIAKKLLDSEPAQNAIDGRQSAISSVHGIKPEKCPSCTEMAFINENGCVICKACGFTKCD